MGAFRGYFNAGVHVLPGVRLGLSENGGKAETRPRVLALLSSHHSRDLHGLAIHKHRE
jgi:hypothetical protein